MSVGVDILFEAAYFVERAFCHDRKLLSALWKHVLAEVSQRTLHPAKLVDCLLNLSVVDNHRSILNIPFASPGSSRTCWKNATYSSSNGVSSGATSTSNPYRLVSPACAPARQYVILERPDLGSEIVRREQNQDDVNVVWLLAAGDEAAVDDQKPSQARRPGFVNEGTEAGQQLRPLAGARESAKPPRQFLHCTRVNTNRQQSVLIQCGDGHPGTLRALPRPGPCIPRRAAPPGAV
jgi:hypothetical protein